MTDRAPSQPLVEQALAASNQARFADAVAALQQVISAGDHANLHNANLIDILSRGADLPNVARLAPFRLNTLVHCGWLNSVIHGRPVNAQGDPIPWFTYPAIDFLEPKIQPDWTVLEWGCGNSTLWWAQRAKRVFSVEHDPAWYEKMRQVAPTNVKLCLAQNEDRYCSQDLISQYAPYDAIVIDGQWRNRCVAAALPSIKTNGIIVFENSDRAELREGMATLASNGWRHIDFFGLLPSYCFRTCTSIFFREETILTLGPLPCDTRTSLGPTCAQVLGE